MVKYLRLIQFLKYVKKETGGKIIIGLAIVLCSFMQAYFVARGVTLVFQKEMENNILMMFLCAIGALVVRVLFQISIRENIRIGRLSATDEEVSNLDTENEKEILDGIRSQKSGKTVVIVAHRVSTLHSVDRILVFDHGELVQTKEVKAVSAI